MTRCCPSIRSHCVKLDEKFGRGDIDDGTQELAAGIGSVGDAEEITARVARNSDSVQL